MDLTFPAVPAAKSWPAIPATTIRLAAGRTIVDYPVLNQVDRLNLLSDELPHLPFPHSSQVEGELRELRCHYGRTHYRVLYRRSDRLLILLHAFAKRTKTLLRSRRRAVHGLGTAREDLVVRSQRRRVPTASVATLPSRTNPR